MLSLEELKQLEKDLKMKKASRNVSCVSTLALSPKEYRYRECGAERAAIESALIRQASQQSILLPPSLHPRGKTGEQPARPLRVKRSQCVRLRQMVMKTLGTSPSFCSTSLLVYEVFLRNACSGE